MCRQCMTPPTGERPSKIRPTARSWLCANSNTPPFSWILLVRLRYHLLLEFRHHVEYLFPVTHGTFVHGGGGVEIMTEHLYVCILAHSRWYLRRLHINYVARYANGCASTPCSMLEGHDQDCSNTFIDNILVTRASPQRFCDGIDSASYDSVCPDITEFHPSISMDSYISLPVCNALVTTIGGTCHDYCASPGRVCRHGQDNVGNECTLDPAHDRQSMEMNGCLQSWGNQICGCAELDDGLDSMVFRATSNVGGIDGDNAVVARTAHGSECQLYNNQGGRGGHDSGRCGVTRDGELYAYYHDAVAWCEDDNPNCGFRMGPLVRTAARARSSWILR